MLLEQTQSWIFSSDPVNGAVNLNKDGNQFDIYLNEPISIPKNAVSCTLEVVRASVWYVSPNISEEIKNNKLVFEYTPVTLNAASNERKGAEPKPKDIIYNYTIPDGLYSISDLNSWLSRKLTEDSLPSDLFVFSAVNSTQKSVITFGYDGCQILFTAPNSINELLGFEPIDVPAAGTSTAGDSYEGENTAALNRLESYLVHCSLAPQGIPVNSKGSNIICEIPITSDSEPGGLLVYTPFNPIKVNCANLIGAPVGTINMRISDQRDRQIDMLSEYWSVTIVLKYYLQMADRSESTKTFKNAHVGSAW